MTESGGLPLFELNASVGIDTTNFTTGITTLSTSITGLNTDVSGMLASIDSIAAEIYANMTEAASAADTATTEINEAMEAMPESELEGVEEAFKQAKETADEAAKAAEEAKTGMDDAADGADEAAEELDDAVNDMDDSAEEGGDGFEKFAEKVGAAWEAVKNFAATMIEVGTALVEAYLEGEASDRAFSFQFGDDTDAALESLERLAEYSGIYSGRIQESYMAMHKAIAESGLEQAEALGATEGAMRLAITAAAAYGLELDEASESVREFLRGNLEAGEEIGLNVDEETMSAWAQRMYGSEWDDLTDDQRLMSLMQYAYEAYRGEEFGAAREAQKNAVQTQLDNFNAIWADIQAIIGEPIARELGRVAQEFNALLQDPAYQLIFTKVGEVIGAVVGWVADLMIEVIKWAGDLEPEDVTKFLDDVKNTFVEIGNFFKEVGVVWNGIKNFFGGSDSGETDAGAWGEEVGSYHVYAPSISNEEKDAILYLLNTRGKKLTSAQETRAAEEGQYLQENAPALYAEVMRAIEDSRYDMYNSQYLLMDLTDNGKIDLSLTALSASLDALDSDVVALTTAISGFPGAISGASVVMDTQKVGHLVAPTVLGDMARTARSRVNTGGAFG